MLGSPGFATPLLFACLPTMLEWLMWLLLSRHPLTLGAALLLRLHQHANKRCNTSARVWSRSTESDIRSKVMPYVQGYA